MEHVTELALCDVILDISIVSILLVSRAIADYFSSHRFKSPCPVMRITCVADGAGERADLESLRGWFRSALLFAAATRLMAAVYRY
jgi:hypothetical protein